MQLYTLLVFFFCCPRDCSQFEFLNCDDSNKRKLVVLDVRSQTLRRHEVKATWRSQCPIYIRPNFQIPNVKQGVSTKPSTG